MSGHMIEIAKHLSASVKEISSISLCKFFEVVESSYISDVFLLDLSLPRLSKLLIVYTVALRLCPYHCSIDIRKLSSLILDLEVRR